MRGPLLLESVASCGLPGDADGQGLGKGWPSCISS